MTPRVAGSGAGESTVSFADEQVTGLRDARKPCHFWIDNEVADCYQPIVGADAVWVYCRIARYAYGAWIVSPKAHGGDRRVSLREMAEWCGKSVDTVWRCLQVLQHVGLIRAEQSAKSKGRYALVDVKDLVSREGGSYDREMGSMQLPAARIAELQAEVKALRVKLARKTSGLEIVGVKVSATASVAQSDSLERSLFSVPGNECDRSVAQSDKTVAHGATAFINTKQQDSKTERTPQPPSLRDGGDQGRSSETLANEPAPSGGIEIALQRVMDECGFTANRLRKKLRNVMQQRMRVAVMCAESVADEMIAAWHSQAKNSRLLFRVVQAAEFFEGGLWLDMNRWNWDQRAVREEQTRVEARAGSY